MNEPQIGQIEGIIEKLAAEVVFAEASTDSGLLPVNSLLRQIEELVTTSAAPESAAKAVDSARRWLDEIFDTTGVFSVVAIKRFNHWVEWMQNSVRTLKQKGSLPDIPSDWERVAPRQAKPVQGTIWLKAYNGPQKLDR